jgi:hypothetical protein
MSVKPKPLTKSQTTKKLTSIASAFGFLTLSSKFSFGKYSGKKVSSVLRTDPKYICWVHENTSHKFVGSVISEAKSNILLNSECASDDNGMSFDSYGITFEEVYE